MTENIEKNVLMKYATCSYEEYVLESDLKLLRHLPPATKEDKMV